MGGKLSGRALECHIVCGVINRGVANKDLRREYTVAAVKGTLMTFE